MARTKLALPLHLFGTWAPVLVAGLLLGSVIAAACGGDDRDAASVETEPAASETTGGDEASEVAVAAPSEADKSEETPPAVVDAPADEPAAIEPVEEPAPSSAPRANVLRGSAEYAEGVGYFPEKMSVAHAENFGVEHFANYKVVTVPEPTPGGGSGNTRGVVEVELRSADAERRWVVRVGGTKWEAGSLGEVASRVRGSQVR
ncbi:MAG: hypothetical protein OXG19_05330 [Chloroflexi bacterium]|nr:hypothetical protein [Chloroflexota bacterium]